VRYPNTLQIIPLQDIYYFKIIYGSKRRKITNYREKSKMKPMQACRAVNKVSITEVYAMPRLPKDEGKRTQVRKSYMLHSLRFFSFSFIYFFSFIGASRHLVSFEPPPYPQFILFLQGEVLLGVELIGFQHTLIC
jgi:hypothetical protein